MSGGAEQQSWQLAQHIAGAGYAVDALTTCSASASEEWSRNVLPAGVERAGDVTIKRFRVDKRDPRAFARVNTALTTFPATQVKRSVSPLSEDDAMVFETQNINSEGLLQYLETEGRRYRALIFIPYLYGTTLAGIQLVSERAFLQPCLHNESYAYLPAVRRAFHSARGVLFNSLGELEIAVELYGPGIIKKSSLVGQGVEVLTKSHAYSDRIGYFVPRNEHYVLYLGRQDPRKNVSLLVHAFGEFRRRHPMSRLKLVLAGGRTATYGDVGKGIVDLGVVDEAEKSALLSNARALVQPSLMESYSRVVMESWLHGRPVVVNERCDATAAVVRECEGGMLAGSVASWENVLYQIDTAQPQELDATGARGKAHAIRYSSWPLVVEAYERALALDEPPFGSVPRPVEAVRQVWSAELPRERYYAEALARTLRRAHVQVLDGEPLIPDVAARLLVHYACGAPEPEPPADPTAALIFHTGVSNHAKGDCGCETFLAREASRYRHVFGSSPKSVAQLDASAGVASKLLPICVDPRDWDCDDDRPLAKALQDGCTNLVYVGPFNALEPLEQLLTAFLHFLTLEGQARLVLIGRDNIDDAVYASISAKVRSLDLVDRVLLARDVTGPQLQSVYRCAHLFWSLEDGDSFGEGFLQAMWFDVPVLAYKTDVSERFVGEAGLLVLDKNDLLAVASLAQMIVTDRELRRRIVRAQRSARERFDGEGVAKALLDQFASAAAT